MNKINLTAYYATIKKKTGKTPADFKALAIEKGHFENGNRYQLRRQPGGTGYVRNRDLEFSQKQVPRPKLIAGLELLWILTTDFSL